MKKIMLLLLLPAYGKAWPQQTLQLDSILAIIKQNNPSVKGYEARIRSLDEGAAGARSWDAPQLGTGLWMAPYNPERWKGPNGMGQYMVSAQQMFPNKKRQDAEEKYMRNMSAVETEKKLAAINELYAAAKQYYYQWVMIKKKLALLGQYSRLLDLMVRTAELRYRNNLGKINAYYKARAAWGNIENMQIALENEQLQKRTGLNILMNRDRAAAFDIDTVAVIKNYEGLHFDTASFAAARSDIRAMENDIRLALLQQDAEKAKRRPEFGVRYDHMFGFGGIPMQYSLMGMVRLPMVHWASKASKAAAESLKWKAGALQWQKQSMINDAAGAAFTVMGEIAAKKRQVKLFEENIIPALQKNYQVMQLGYEQNTEELFTLFDAWETLSKTQLEYLDLLQDLLLMQVELERILELK